MGMPGPFKRSCFTNYTQPAPNPSPDRWTLLYLATFENGYAMKVKYDDCTNFEGVKIMVFKGQYENRIWLDPHFSENEKAPIARFKPTSKGWDMAIKLAKEL
jgi:hypothetical protein